MIRRRWKRWLAKHFTGPVGPAGEAGVCKCRCRKGEP